jgi:hypothetical protein
MCCAVLCGGVQHLSKIGGSSAHLLDQCRLTLQHDKHLLISDGSATEE